MIEWFGTMGNWCCMVIGLNRQDEERRGEIRATKIPVFSENEYLIIDSDSKIQ